MPALSARLMGSLKSLGSVTVRPMPSGLPAVAWSIKVAVFSRSNLSGPRMVTSTPMSFAASLMPCSTVHQKESHAHSACCTMMSLSFLFGSTAGAAAVGATVGAGAFVGATVGGTAVGCGALVGAVVGGAAVGGAAGGAVGGGVAGAQALSISAHTTTSIAERTIHFIFSSLWNGQRVMLEPSGYDFNPLNSDITSFLHAS